jgi:hypothetical protein
MRAQRGCGAGPGSARPGVFARGLTLRDAKRRQTTKNGVPGRMRMFSGPKERGEASRS